MSSEQLPQTVNHFYDRVDETDPDQVKRGLERFYETGQRQDFYFGDDVKQFNEFISSLGHEKLDTSSVKIVYYEYRGEADSYAELFDEVMLSGDSSVEVLLNQVADRGATNEFPNDFKVSILVNIDKDTAVVYRLISEEVAGVCDGCFGARLSIGWDAGACEHDTTECIFQHTASIAAGLDDDDKLAMTIN